eukprot:TRINITY_DN6300_c0_g1_i2.p1 TRINITY_DN6300_c0_g1~~TRINITY_DN6300_c0_g1_i2.p1  ORF type:complete len:117 (+),score=20.09 TRINITY_DN6300_c0_g1_i2:208-558(+)
MAFCCVAERNANHKEMFDLLLEHGATLLSPVNRSNWSPIGKMPCISNLVLKWECKLQTSSYQDDPVDIYVQVKGGNRKQGEKYWQSIQEKKEKSERDLSEDEWAFVELVRRRTTKK